MAASCCTCWCCKGTQCHALHIVKDKILHDIPHFLGRNPAAAAPAAKAGISITEAVAAAAAAEGGAISKAVVAPEAEVGGAAAAPIQAVLVQVACVCPCEPSVCEQLAAEHHMSYWQHYSFAEVLLVYICFV